MHCLYILHKPIGITSAEFLRTHPELPKGTGHFGTLDPFAEGQLIAGSGDAAKLQPFFLTLSKTYVGSLQLGRTTPSLDPETPVSRECEVPPLKVEEIQNVMNRFVGTREQIPPIYSAKRIHGQRAHEIARASTEEGTTPPEMKPIQITLYKFKNIEWDAHEKRIQFEAEVSGGTYIRTLGADLAFALNTCGYLTALKRTHIGPLSVSRNFTSYSWHEIAKLFPNYIRVCSELERQQLLQGHTATHHALKEELKANRPGKASMLVSAETSSFFGIMYPEKNSFTDRYLFRGFPNR